MSRLIDFAPVRLGVAGLGRAGMFHIERIGLRDDCRVVAAYDDCPAARNRAAHQAFVNHANWNEFLRNDEVELVLIAAPPALHAELSIAALAAGKHVLIETPMCLNVQESDAIIAAARRTVRSVCVAQTRRWDDDFRTAQATLAAGALGAAQAIKLINWQYNPRWCNGRPHNAPGTAGLAIRAEVAPGSDIPVDNWRNAAATGGGVLWEFGIHYFDQLLLLAGRAVESVYARLAPASSACCGEDTFLAIIGFSGGLTAHVEVSRTAPAPLSTGWMIAGLCGSYAGFTQYLPTPDGEVADLPALEVIDARRHGQEPLPCGSAPGTSLAGQADGFYAQLVRHLRFGEPIPVAAEEARRTIALIEAVRESARSGQAISLNESETVLIR